MRESRETVIALNCILLFCGDILFSVEEGSKYDSTSEL